MLGTEKAEGHQSRWILNGSSGFVQFQKVLEIGIVPLSFIFDKYYLIID